MMKDRRGTLDGGEPVGRRREGGAERSEKPALEVRHFARFGGATMMAHPEPPRDTAVGHVRRVGPVDGDGVDVEGLRDRAEITLIVDRVGRRESAVDIEKRELARIETPLAGQVYMRRVSILTSRRVRYVPATG